MTTEELNAIIAKAESGDIKAMNQLTHIYGEVDGFINHEQAAKWFLELIKRDCDPNSGVYENTGYNKELYAKIKTAVLNSATEEVVFSSLSGGNGGSLLGGVMSITTSNAKKYIAQADKAIEQRMIYKEEQRRKAAEEAARKKAEEERARKEAADREAAKKVIDKIVYIGDVEYTEDCKMYITSARTAYDSLTASQKTLVNNSSILVAAEKEFAKLKKAEEIKAAEEAKRIREERARQKKEQEEKERLEREARARKASERLKQQRLEQEEKAKLERERIESDYLDESPFMNCSGNFIIPKGTTKIGKKAFAGCHKITSISIPLSVITIGENAFADCDGLESMTIPSSVITIGKGAFEGCRRLVVFSDKCLNISACTKLTSFEIPSHITSIDENVYNIVRHNSHNFVERFAIQKSKFPALDKLPNLVTVNVDERNPSLCSIDGVLCTKDKKSLILCPKGKSGIFHIPEGISCIEHGAFMRCEQLTSVTLPHSVISIGVYAFLCCSKLTSINIPDSVTTIGEQSFSGCGLNEVVIPMGVKKVGEMAFYSSPNLWRVEIIDKATQFAPYTFNKCPKLISLTVPIGKKKYFEKLFSNYGIPLPQVKESNSIPQVKDVAKKIDSDKQTEYSPKTKNSGGLLSSIWKLLTDL